MRIFFVSAILFFVVSISISVSQEISLENWNAYISLLDIKDADFDDNGNILACADGGALRYIDENQTFEIFDNIGKLLSIELNVVRWNSNTKDIYFASADGFLDILDNSGNWYHATGINTTGFSNKSINDINFYGNKAYIVGGFGLAVFDTEKRIFIENVPRFGRFNNSVIVNKISIKNDIIYLATTQGLAIADINSLLADPNTWQTFEEVDNNLNIEDIELISDSIFVKNDISIYNIDLNDEQIVYNKISDIPGLSDISQLNGELIFSQYGFVISRKQGVIYTNAENFVAGLKGIDNKILIYKVGNGLDVLDIDGTLESYKPNSPASNGFTDIEVTNDGNLWIAADYLGQGIGKGIMNFNGSEWNNFTFPEYNQIKSNGYSWISIINDNKIVASNFGNGLLTIENTPDNRKFTIYNDTNSVLTGYDGGSFVVAGENRVDRFGNIWVVNYAESGIGPALVAITPDGKDYGYENRTNVNNRKYYSLAIDQNGTKWAGSYPGVGNGIMYYNENNTLDNYSDDIYGMISSTSTTGLSSNDISSIEVDKLGIVWVGTSSGLSAIINPAGVFNNSGLVVRNVNLISDNSVNDIIVDAQNNKWIATEKGVWVLNPDATELLGIIDKENSPLPTNSILSLATDENNGKIYFGTSKGLYSAVSLFVKPLDAFDIKSYPQPFNIPENEFMVIDGLAPGSAIRILTTNGQLIRSLSSDSRKVTWDGRNESGELVKTGVYLLVTSSSSTDASSVQKIAVINQ